MFRSTGHRRSAQACQQATGISSLPGAVLRAAVIVFRSSRYAITISISVALGIIPFVVLLRRLLCRLVLPPQDGPVDRRLGYRPALWTRSRQSSHVPLV